MLEPHPDPEFSQDGTSECFQRSLETELKSQLNDSGFSSRGDSAEKRVAQRKGPATVRVEMVECVERFESELPVEALREADAFKERKIGTPETRSVNGAASSCTNVKVSGRNVGKGVRIEPFLQSLGRSNVWIANLVRTYGAWTRPETTQSGRVGI